jgi:thiol-disulfide isomerase/thioredoxin
MARPQRFFLPALLVAMGVSTGAEIVFSAPAKKLPDVVTTDVAGVMSAVRRPGARAVLVNVWATWCDPCVEEMPDILKFYRDNQSLGLRLVLVSADSASARKKVARFLASMGVDFRSYLKTGDDMVFIDGLDPRWDGTLPTSLLFDGSGQRRHLWSGAVTYDALKKELDRVLTGKLEASPPDSQAKRRNP